MTKICLYKNSRLDTPLYRLYNPTDKATHIAISIPRCTFRVQREYATRACATAYVSDPPAVIKIELPLCGEARHSIGIDRNVKEERRNSIVLIIEETFVVCRSTMGL